MTAIALLLLGLGLAASWLGTVVGTCTQAANGEMWAGLLVALTFGLGSLLVILLGRPKGSLGTLGFPLLAILPAKLFVSLSLIWSTGLRGHSACAWKTGSGFGAPQAGDLWLAVGYLLTDLLVLACVLLLLRRDPKPAGAKLP